MNTCIINYAKDGRENYEAGQERLRQSLVDVGYKGSLMLCNQVPVGCPEHSEVSHAFKAYLFKCAFECGFDLVLWLDASVVVQKPLGPVWDIIKGTGTLFNSNGDWRLNQWAGNTQLLAMGCPVVLAPQVLICCSAVVGLSAYDVRCQSIVSTMVNLVHVRGGVAYHGSTDATSPDFKEVRHDQNVFSWMAYQYKLLYHTGVACYDYSSYVKDATFVLTDMGGL